MSEACEAKRAGGPSGHSVFSLMLRTRVWFGNVDALRFELVNLIAQASNRNPQRDGRPGSVAFEMIEGLDNEFALNFRDRVANQLLKN